MLSTRRTIIHSSTLGRYVGLTKLRYYQRNKKNRGLFNDADNNNPPIIFTYLPARPIVSFSSVYPNPRNVIEWFARYPASEPYGVVAGNLLRVGTHVSTRAMATGARREKKQAKSGLACNVYGTRYVNVCVWTWNVKYQCGRGPRWVTEGWPFRQMIRRQCGLPCPVQPTATEEMRRHISDFI